MRLVMDTDVLVAAMRIPSGASAPLLVRLLRRRVSMLPSVALALEYEAVCMMAKHRLAAGANEATVRDPLDTVIDVAVPVEVHYQWRPQLNDAGDEMVLETALNGQADAITTFNRRHYRDVPSSLGIGILSPRETLKRIGQWQ